MQGRTRVRHTKTPKTRLGRPTRRRWRQRRRCERKPFKRRGKSNADRNGTLLAGPGPLAARPPVRSSIRAVMPPSYTPYLRVPSWREPMDAHRNPVRKVSVVLAAVAQIKVAAEEATVHEEGPEPPIAMTR